MGRCGEWSATPAAGTCAGAKGADGCHTDTTDVDCEVCKTDLWLSAVCSAAAPGRAVCPEHAAHLPGPRPLRLLLCRHTPGAASSPLAFFVSHARTHARIQASKQLPAMLIRTAQ